MSTKMRDFEKLWNQFLIFDRFGLIAEETPEVKWLV